MDLLSWQRTFYKSEACNLLSGSIREQVADNNLRHADWAHGPRSLPEGACRSFPNYPDTPPISPAEFWFELMKFYRTAQF